MVVQEVFTNVSIPRLFLWTCMTSRIQGYRDLCMCCICHSDGLTCRAVFSLRFPGQIRHQQDPGALIYLCTPSKHCSVYPVLSGIRSITLAICDL